MTNNVRPNTDALLEEASGSFVRAVRLATERGLDQTEIRRLQKQALRQYFEEYRNFEGAAKLVDEYELSPDDVREVVESVLANDAVASIRTFCYRKGKASSRSIGEQVRAFAASRVPR